MPTAPKPRFENTVDPTYTRLHITPLDPALLPVVLPASIFPDARNISFHCLETFPEKPYGFVDLPAADAERLKKRLNGAVLKGCKVRVEIARPSSMARPVGETALAVEKTGKKEQGDKKSKETTKKRKWDTDEIDGVQLRGGRKIKRGWTSPSEPKLRRDKKKDKDGKCHKKDKRKEAKSKYTEGPECLVKTILPPSASAPADGEADSLKKKRKRGNSREVVVHEFEKTTKFPSFLKTPSAASKSENATEFVDGKGWINEDGNVVEAVRSKTKPATDDKPAEQPHMHDPEGNAPRSKDLSEDESEEERNTSDTKRIIIPSKSTVSTAPAATPVSILKSGTNRPKSSGSTKSLTIKIPPPPSTPSTTAATASTASKTEIHPLEALYKRPRLPNGTLAMQDSSTNASFSFFESDNVEPDGEGGGNSGEGDGAVARGDSSTWAHIQMPMTPFTRLDFESRGVRSAAPTPDTAHAARGFPFWGRGESGITGHEDSVVEEEDEAADGGEECEQPDSPQLARKAFRDGMKDGEGAAQQSNDFQKWFWEHRGDLNRSWKRRKKEAAKEKRYKDNRAKGGKII